MQQRLLRDEQSAIRYRSFIGEYALPSGLEHYHASLQYPRGDSPRIQLRVDVLRMAPRKAFKHHALSLRNKGIRVPSTWTVLGTCHEIVNILQGLTGPERKTIRC